MCRAFGRLDAAIRRFENGSRCLSVVGDSIGHLGYFEAGVPLCAWSCLRGPATGNSAQVSQAAQQAFSHC